MLRDLGVTRVEADDATLANADLDRVAAAGCCGRSTASRDARRVRGRRSRARRAGSQRQPEDRRRLDRVPAVAHHEARHERCAATRSCISVKFAPVGRHAHLPAAGSRASTNRRLSADAPAAPPIAAAIRSWFRHRRARRSARSRAACRSSPSASVLPTPKRPRRVSPRHARGHRDAAEAAAARAGGAPDLPDEDPRARAAR